MGYLYCKKLLLIFLGFPFLQVFLLLCSCVHYAISSSYMQYFVKADSFSMTKELFFFLCLISN